MNLARWKDGLYRVECGSFCAGFVVSKGHFIAMAPCLRKHLDNFARFAVWICPLTKPSHATQEIQHQ